MHVYYFVISIIVVFNLYAGRLQQIMTEVFQVIFFFLLSIILAILIIHIGGRSC